MDNNSLEGVINSYTPTKCWDGDGDIDGNEDIFFEVLKIFLWRFWKYSYCIAFILVRLNFIISISIFLFLRCSNLHLSFSILLNACLLSIMHMVLSSPIRLNASLDLCSILPLSQPSCLEASYNWSRRCHLKCSQAKLTLQ